MCWQDQEGAEVGGGRAIRAGLTGPGGAGP